MREVLGPYRAALTLGRRRSIVLLLFVVVALFGALSWGTYRELNDQRHFLAVLESGKVSKEALFHFNINCRGGPFEPAPPPEPGQSPVTTEPSESPATTGPSESPATSEPSESPPGIGFEGKPIGPPGFQEVPTCQFMSNNGVPIGPEFQGDPYGPDGPKLSQDAIDRIRPELIAGQRILVNQIERGLGPRWMFQTRVHALGTFVGIVFAVLLGATIFGAEFRWGVWRSLLTHEPRRGRVLRAKYAALWTLVLIGFAATLAAMTGVDVVMRIVSNIEASGGPSTLHLAKESGWALLSVEVFSTIAAALAIAVRTSLAGIATLLLTVGDNMLVQKYHWLRHFSPVQQVAYLLPTPMKATTAYVWFSQVTGGFICDQPDPNGFGVCREIILKPIPHWRASVVLGGWMIAFVLAALAIFRARDVPQ